MRSVHLCRSLRLVAALGAVAVVTTAVPAAARGSSPSFPDVTSLPNSWRPEGIVIDPGTTLDVAQNTPNQIAVAILGPYGTAGTISNVLTDTDLEVPATADLFGRAVYAVNARFTSTPGPEVAYGVVRVGPASGLLPPCTSGT